MNIDALMEQLKKDYVKSIPEKIDTLMHFYNAGDSLGVRQVFHKLKGTGFTYGIPEISVLGETFENLCTREKQVPKAVTEAIELLRIVYSHRSENKEYDLSKDERYVKVRNLLG